MSRQFNGAANLTVWVTGTLPKQSDEGSPTWGNAIFSSHSVNRVALAVLPMGKTYCNNLITSVSCPNLGKNFITFKRHYKEILTKIDKSCKRFYNIVGKLRGLFLRSGETALCFPRYGFPE